MNLKERVMVVIRREKPDKLPWLSYSYFLPTGFWERKLRNMGLGVVLRVRVWDEETPNVRVEERIVGNILYRKYHTPVGTASTKQRRGMTDFVGGARPGESSAGSYGGVWTIEYMIKDLSDYDIAKFIIEDTIYTPNYQQLIDTAKNLGGDGVVFVRVEPSPFQKLMKELMGYRTLALGLYRHRKEFEKLLSSIGRKQEEIYRIVADSPAELVQIPENINGIVTSPQLFERYCLPFYKKNIRMLHAKDKICLAHMDGKLACLKELIKQTDLDVIEAFTPPPMGDLTIEEAKITWKEKFIIWINFPGSICLQGTTALRDYTIQLLKRLAPGDNFILGVTEDIPPPVDVNLTAITEVINEYGNYPIALT